MNIMWRNKLELFSTNECNHEYNENYINDCINYYNDFYKSSQNLTNCPHCNSSNIVKYGSLKSGGNIYRRHLCKGCKKTFSEVTTSPLSCSKKDIQTWAKYIGCMAKGMTLKSIASELKINVKTAFAWRHKILSSIENKIMAHELCHHVQIDETIMRKNLKGNKKVPLENKKARLKYSRFEAPSNERIKIISCIDDSENIILRGIDTSTIHFADAKKIFRSTSKTKSNIVYCKKYCIC